MTRRSLTLALAALLLSMVLAMPPQPAAAARGIGWVPVELPFVLAILCVFGRLGRMAVTIALTALAILKIADLAMYSALGRSFNPVADLPLIDASMRMVGGTFGTVAAVAMACLALASTALIAGVIWWAAGVWSAPRWGARARAAGFTIALIGALAVPAAGLKAQNGSYFQGRLDLARDTLGDLQQLRQAARTDPYMDRTGLMAAIDRDVLIIFIESYGRTSFDTPFYADRHRATLRKAEAQLSAAGLSMRSGFLTPPTKGGQSWLSHSTFASGLWISDQARYHALRASGRQNLFHLARRSGFRTAAVMPAITRPWPEAEAMGFDRVLSADDLGYRGKPFNWVTMPDQFTLAAMDRLLRRDSGNLPLFLQVALISSHAPWVPVPRILPWDQIGDGREFDKMAEAGDPPKVVWRDRERVKAQYREAVDYALQAAFGYAARQAGRPPLMLILGDHQAAPRIAMDEGRDVALHVIGPEALVERAADWGFAPGLIPPDDLLAIPMDRMRDLILTSFDSAEPPA